MEIAFEQPHTAEQYRHLVQTYSFLVDAEMKLVEDEPSDSYLAERLPALISAVNVIGYLRGQHGVFVDARPPLDFQKELYRNEDAFEGRLAALVRRVEASASAGSYAENLRAYYLNRKGGPR